MRHVAHCSVCIWSNCWRNFTEMWKVIRKADFDGDSVQDSNPEFLKISIWILWILSCLPGGSTRLLSVKLWNLWSPLFIFQHGDRDTDFGRFAGSRAGTRRHWRTPRDYSVRRIYRWGRSWQFRTRTSGHPAYRPKDPRSRRSTSSCRPPSVRRRSCSASDEIGTSWCCSTCPSSLSAVRSAAARCCLPYLYAFINTCH